MRRGPIGEKVGRFGRWAVVSCGLLLTLSGCELLKGLLGEEAGGQGKVEACVAAEACCTELMEATAYDEVAERAGQRGWPNHCPSWNARSQQECRSLLDAVKAQKATLIKDHPVFEAQRCE